jgi:hypothetical protein
MYRAAADMQANVVFMHIKSFMTLEFKFKLLLRTEKFEIYIHLKAFAAIRCVEGRCV